MKKRILSLAMAVLLCVQILPLGGVAAVNQDTNLCEHHTAHDAAVCGYVEYSPAVSCTHGAHTDSCYEVKCSHVCDASCEKYTDCNFTCDGSDACVTKTPTGEHDAGCYTTQCIHVCGEACTDPCTFSCANEGDCVTQVLNCQNTAACYTTVCSHVHDSTCRTLLPCAFTCTNEESCLTKTLTCTHEEDGSCCAREEVTAVACAYSCQECAAASIAEGDTCTCSTKCVDTANAACPVCSVDGAVLVEVCTGQAADTTKYWVTVTESPFDGSGGTVSGEGEYAPGDQVTISIAPNTDGGYCAAQWGLTDVGEGIIPAINQKTSHTFTMPENAVQISITFTQHSYITYSDLENGTHQNQCFYCEIPYGVPENHVDDHGGGDGTTPPDGWCDKCSERIPGKSIVQFDGNHQDAIGHVYDQIVDTGSSTTLPVSGFTLDGHTFQGWSTTADGSGTLYQANDAYSVEADTTFYAIWKSNATPTTYTITPSAEGGSYDASTNTLTIIGGGTVNLTLNVSGSVYFYDSGEFTMTPVNGDAESATKWTTTLPNVNKTYHFYHNLSNLQAECIIIVKKAYTLTLKDGDNARTYNFAPGTVVDLSDYWPANLTQSNGGGFLVFATENDAELYSVTMTEDITLKEVWPGNPTYGVTLDPQGGTLPYKKIRGNDGESYSTLNKLHIPTRAGYTFLSWSLTPNVLPDDLNAAVLNEDCTLYAVWQQDSPSNDDGYYDPPSANEPVKIVGDYDAVLRDDTTVNIGGGYDAVLRDGMVIVRGEDPISGTLDLGKADAEAIRLPTDAVKASTGEGNSATIRYPDGISAFITGSGFAAAEESLRPGESLQIAVRPVDAGALPENLTAPPEDGEPFEDDVLFNKSILCGGSNIFTEQELLDLNVIDENDDDITWNELKYLYHYMTTTELKTLGLIIDASLGDNIDPQVLVWVNEMIERDRATVSLNSVQLNESGILSKLEDVGYTGDAITLGLLRQADLDMEQLEYIIDAMQEIIGVWGSGEEDLILAWANEAIAQKELEASYAQMDSLIEEARSTNGSYTGLNDVKDAAKDMTTDELERFLAKANAAKSSDWGTLPVLALGALDKIIEYLNSELEARQAQEDAQDAPTYINVGGERAVFVGAVEADVKAVRADGATRNIEILADRSNAVAWSTTVQVPTPLLDAPEWNVNKLRTYKVLDNGSLEAKAAKVTLNADGTLTASALSNGNSTYIFVLEPNPYTDVDEDDWYYDAAMTMDQRLVTLGASSTSFGGGEPVSHETVWTALARLAGVIIENTPAQEWVVAQGISDGANGDKNITREQLARMLWQYAKSIGMDVSVGESTNILSYTDVAEVSEDSIPAMQWAMGAGILPNMGEELQPQREATRRETAVALTRFIGEESPHTHAWEWVTDQEATTTAEGAKHEACVCGAVQNRGTVIEEIETPKAPQPVEAPQPAAQPEKEDDLLGMVFSWFDSLMGKLMK